MADHEINEAVRNMVRDQIRKDPNVKNTELRGKAFRIDPSIDDLSPRQFHATYRLPIAREVASEGQPKKTVEKPAEPVREPAPEPAAQTKQIDRQHTKRILVELATELAGAEPVKLVRVMGGLDEWVERIQTQT